MSTSIRKEADKVPEPTLRRLPWYLSNIKLMKEKGEQYVSSTQISKEINIDASQIAKDLSYVNISGRTRVGYNIDALIEVLESFLGFTNMHKAFLFGVGSLGGALLRDLGLRHFGLYTNNLLIYSHRHQSFRAMCYLRRTLRFVPEIPEYQR